MSRRAAGLETDDRLLAAAGEVFAEVGYRSATLREICRRSQANIAAVNYHFRDKEHLYAAVLEQAVAEAGEGLARIAPDPADPPELKLQHFIRQFLGNLLGGERPVRFLRLMAHESIEPTSAFDWVVEKAASPLKEMIEEIVAEFFGPGTEPVRIHDCAASVLMQCAAYYHSEAFVRRLDHLNVHDPATIEHLANHIYRFSLGGIRTLASEA